MTSPDETEMRKRRIELVVDVIVERVKVGALLLQGVMLIVLGAILWHLAPVYDLAVLAHIERVERVRPVLHQVAAGLRVADGELRAGQVEEASARVSAARGEIEHALEELGEGVTR